MKNVEKLLSTPCSVVVDVDACGSDSYDACWRAVSGGTTGSCTVVVPTLLEYFEDELRND